MRIVIAGGSGYIGRHLTRRLREGGARVVWLSHRPGRASGAGAYGPDLEVAFDPHERDASWAEELAGADAVVNLSGHPISSRWNPTVKHLLRESRVETGRALVTALAALDSAHRPPVYVSASGVGYYGDRADDILGETEPPGEDWLSRLAVDWEAEALRAAEHEVRPVVVRTGLVLGDVGLVPRMKLPFQLFAGGPVGTGRQYVSWTHIDDIARVYEHAIACEELSGPVNASGEPLRMREFASALGRVLGRPSWFPVPMFALKLVMGEVAPYLVMSQRADTAKLLSSGFTPRFMTAEDALRDVLGR